MALARLSETDPAEYAFVESICLLPQGGVELSSKSFASFRYYLQVSFLSDIAQEP
jgi:Trk-type K+ transport system membrane component